MTTHDTETLAEVLAAHQPRVEKSGRIHMCSCGEWVADIGVPSSHRWHVARALAARIVQARAGDGALRERIEALVVPVKDGGPTDDELLTVGELRAALADTAGDPT